MSDNDDASTNVDNNDNNDNVINTDQLKLELNESINGDDIMTKQPLVQSKKDLKKLKENSANGAYKSASASAAVPVSADTNANAGALVPFNPEQANSELDSGFQSRSNSGKQLTKKILKQAKQIKETSLNSPKAKRIHDSVTKVFGNDDPPPGFGLTNPKYYYLEQKRPQPIQPLKVWRGFNGNIYFEPLAIQKVTSNDSENKHVVGTHPIYTKYSRPSVENKLQADEERRNQIKASKTSESIKSENQNDDTATNAENYVFITQQDETQDNINTRGVSSLETNNGSIAPPGPPMVSRVSQPRESRFKELVLYDPDVTLKPPVTHLKPIFRPISHDSFMLKKKSRSVILPNTALYTKSKLPCRGLAYVEAKTRIYSSGVIKDEKELDEFLARDNTSDTSDSRKDVMHVVKKRYDYRSAKNRIHRGLTNPLRAKQQMRHHNTTPTILAKSDRTTTAYMTFGRKNQKVYDTTNINIEFDTPKARNSAPGDFMVSIPHITYHHNDLLMAVTATSITTAMQSSTPALVKSNSTNTMVVAVPEPAGFLKVKGDKNTIDYYLGQRHELKNRYQLIKEKFKNKVDVNAHLQFRRTSHSLLGLLGRRIY